MPAKINLIGQIFGNLEVLEETSERKDKSVVWRCRCQLCGNDQVIQCPQCGRHREPKENLRENIIGKKYNHLLVLEKTKETSGGKFLYKCLCDCGHNRIVYTTSTSLKNGDAKSCGCQKM